MRHGEVWLVDLAPKVGQEIDKVRPAIIVNHDSMGSLQLKVVVPLTDSSRQAKEWHVQLHPTKKNGLSKVSVADCFQIKSLSMERFVKRLGQLSSDEIDKVKLGMMKVLDLI